MKKDYRERSGEKIRDPNYEVGKDDFDAEKFLKERNEVNKEFIQEFQKDESVRTRSLLLTNFVDKQIKDCVVMLIRSEKARGISREVSIEILNEKNYLDLIYKDLKRINQIRDLFGHNLRMSIIEKEVSNIIENSDVVHALRILIPNWENLSVSEKLHHFALRMSADLDRIFELITVTTSVKDIIDTEANEENNSED